MGETGPTLGVATLPKLLPSSYEESPRSFEPSSVIVGNPKGNISSPFLKFLPYHPFILVIYAPLIDHAVQFVNIIHVNYAYILPLYYRTAYVIDLSVLYPTSQIKHGILQSTGYTIPPHSFALSINFRITTLTGCGSATVRNSLQQRVQVAATTFACEISVVSGRD